MFATTVFMDSNSKDNHTLTLLRSCMGDVRIPDASSKVFKEECCITFDTPASQGGLYVDLSSFLAFGRDAVAWNSAKSGHRVYLHIKRTLKPEMDERPAKKPTLLGIGVEGGYDTREPAYEEIYSVVVLPSFAALHYPNTDLPEKVRIAVDGVLAAEGAERREQVAAWVRDKAKVSQHAAGLRQLDSGVTVPPTGWRCERCDKTDNLWLNLTDGKILCGRRNWDGSGGNNHASEHYAATKYPLAVKLGTITADLAAADVYSYPEDDAVEDPLLDKHLAHFGIDFKALEKTEMTTAERELDQNLNFDWNRIQEKGTELRPMYGPGYTGLANLGNSCYLASVMQVMFALPSFSKRYFASVPLQQAFDAAPTDPTTDLATQLTKLGHGLLSGRYSQEPPVEGADGASSAPRAEAGIPPRMLKSVVGAGHPEFSTSRQQDALEFYQYLLELVERTDGGAGGGAGALPSAGGARAFQFRVQDRIQCGASGKVKYVTKADNVLSLNIPLSRATNKDELSAYEKRREEAEAAGLKVPDDDIVRPHVPLAACLESFAGAEEIQNFYSSAIRARTTALKSSRLATFPDVLVLHMRRFVLSSGSWVAKKLDVFVDVPDEIDITSLQGSRLQPGEELLPEEEDGEEAASASGRERGGAGGVAAPAAEEAIVQQLMDMGFPRVRCEKAALGTSNAGAEEAMNWLFAHMEDPDIDDPVLGDAAAHAREGPTGQAAVDEGLVEMLMSSLGVSAVAAHNGLIATGGDVEQAAEWIFSNPGSAEAPLANQGAAANHEPPAAPPPSPDHSNLADGSGKYELVAFVSHMGANTQCGHYVCHIKKAGQWVIFNDAKVAASGSPPKELGYLYFFQRKPV